MEPNPNEGGQLFVGLACVNYDGGGSSSADRIAEAHRMLEADSTVATGSIEALATVGDHQQLSELLDEYPEAITEECGPYDWPPLLYAIYSRIQTNDPDWSAPETVRVLLEREADPNAGFLWQDLVPPFTALTGTFGNGEGHQSRHPQRMQIARLLLESGADPNDGQTLYNNGIGGENHDDPSHLELLLEFGLGSQQNGPWYERLGSQLRDPKELLYDELEAAIHRDRPRHLALLIQQGLDLNRAIGRSRMTPAQLAAKAGNKEIFQILADAGAN